MRRDAGLLPNFPMPCTRLTGIEAKVRTRAKDQNAVFVGKYQGGWVACGTHATSRSSPLHSNGTAARKLLLPYKWALGSRK
jgi:hypothetical protein